MGDMGDDFRATQRVEATNGWEGEDNGRAGK